MSALQGNQPDKTAVWGVLGRDDVLWLTDEHYCREKPLSYLAQYLPRNVTWYADPSGAGDISELKCAGFVVRKGNNSLGTGIPAVHARLNDGRLRILHGRCPNLLAEAALYASQKHSSAEEPVTARIRRRQEAMPVSDSAVDADDSRGAQTVLPAQAAVTSFTKSQLTFQERIAMERQRQDREPSLS